METIAQTLIRIASQEESKAKWSPDGSPLQAELLADAAVLRKAAELVERTPITEEGK